MFNGIHVKEGATRSRHQERSLLEAIINLHKLCSWFDIAFGFFSCLGIVVDIFQVLHHLEGKTYESTQDDGCNCDKDPRNILLDVTCRNFRSTQRHCCKKSKKVFQFSIRTKTWVEKDS